MKGFKGLLSGKKQATSSGAPQPTRPLQGGQQQEEPLPVVQPYYTATGTPPLQHCWDIKAHSCMQQPMVTKKPVQEDNRAFATTAVPVSHGPFGGQFHRQPRPKPVSRGVYQPKPVALHPHPLTRHELKGDKQTCANCCPNAEVPVAPEAKFEYVCADGTCKFYRLCLDCHEMCTHISDSDVHTLLGCVPMGCRWRVSHAALAAPHVPE